MTNQERCEQEAEEQERSKCKGCGEWYFCRCPIGGDDAEVES